MSQTVIAEREHLARQEKARKALDTYDLDLLLATPGTNFRYLTGVNAHRMERLIAFGLPREGRPFLICPAFEEDNMKRDFEGGDVLTWGESDDPFHLLADAVTKSTGAKSRIGVEPTTWYWMVESIRSSLPAVQIGDAGALFDGLRVAKSDEEARRIRKAADIADGIARKTRLYLREGMTELEAANVIIEMLRRDGPVHEPLVQFGDNSAIPHAGAGNRKLKREDMVLIDLSAIVDGYMSDLTRMTSFGDATTEMKEVYKVVYNAQQAAIEAARPGTPCQDVDRAARRVIDKAGYGKYFIHRTGHGLGMDIHEPPYLVEGNQEPLAAGAVVTIEPGIYLPGRFGIRIEEDVLITDDGPELLSDRQPELIETL